MYWKLCSIVLGFVIAIASHGGPSQASANGLPGGHNVLSLHQQQALAIQEAGANQRLSVGGFDTIQGEPVFVIKNEQGQRVGTLSMTAAAVN